MRFWGDITAAVIGASVSLAATTAAADDLNSMLVQVCMATRAEPAAAHAAAVARGWITATPAQRARVDRGPMPPGATVEYMVPSNFSNWAGVGVPYLFLAHVDPTPGMVEARAINMCAITVPQDFFGPSQGLGEFILDRIGIYPTEIGKWGWFVNETGIAVSIFAADPDGEIRRALGDRPVHLLTYRPDENGRFETTYTFMHR